MSRSYEYKVKLSNGEWVEVCAPSWIFAAPYAIRKFKEANPGYDGALTCTDIQPINCDDIVEVRTMDGGDA